MAAQIWAAEIFLQNLPESARNHLFDINRSGKVFGNKRRGYEEVFVLITDAQFIVYGVGDSIDPMLNFFFQDPALYAHVHFYKSTEACLNHLFATATGLCSDIKGSRKVFKDVQRAHLAALQAGGMGLILDSAVRHALRVSKKVREATGIERLGQALVSAGMDIVFNESANPAELSYLVLGSGEIATSALEFCYHEGFRNVVVACENNAASKNLAKKYTAKSIEYDQIETFIQLSDVVITEDAVVPSMTSSNNMHENFGSAKIFLDFGNTFHSNDHLKNHPSVKLYSIDDINNSPFANANVFHSLEEAWKMVEAESALLLNGLEQLQSANFLMASWKKIVSKGEQEICLLLDRRHSPMGNLEIIRFYNEKMLRDIQYSSIPATVSFDSKSKTKASGLVNLNRVKKLILAQAMHLN
jgi:glutamyl-tRNA reductase